MHAEGAGEPGHPVFFQTGAPAFDVTPLDLFSCFGVPLTHQKSSPLPGGRIRQDGETGKVSPLVLLADMIFFPGICRQADQIHFYFSSGIKETFMKTI